MPKSFNESRLTFTFTDKWSIEKYDEHRDYVDKIQKLKDTKAVDFVGLFDDSVFFFIEVKNFKGYRIQNKERISDGLLAEEIALKVRDTIAGIMGASRTSCDPDCWRPYTKGLRDRNRNLFIVLWLEEDLTLQKPHATTITDLIKKQTKWVTTKVLVVNQRIFSSVPPGVTVKNMAGTM
jgi:hypothetical protein